MIAITDSDILRELMDRLADAVVLLRSALSELPDSQQELKGRMAFLVKEIQLSRLKVIKLVLAEDPAAH